jgi:hypothetical protein
MLFVATLELSFHNISDVGVINHLGRLRLYTQNIGTVLLSKRLRESPLDTSQFAFLLSDNVDTCDAIGAIMDGLLGSDPGISRSVAVPEIIDQDVKDKLTTLKPDIHYLCTIYAKEGSLEDNELVDVMKRLSEATRGLDQIMSTADDSTGQRVELLLALLIYGAIFAVLCGFSVMRLASRVWGLYVANYNNLTTSNVEQSSLLQRSFHAVVSISTCSPFNVSVTSPEFDTLCGSPMEGKTIGACARDNVQMNKLFQALEHAVTQNMTSLTSTKSKRSICALLMQWWEMVTLKRVFPRAISPEATRIPSAFGSGVDVELSLGIVPEENTSNVLVGVRLVSGEATFSQKTAAMTWTSGHPDLDQKSSARSTDNESSSTSGENIESLSYASSSVEPEPGPEGKV